MFSIYRNAFATIGVELSECAYEKLNQYRLSLKEWNQFMNLTAIDDDMGILWRHFIDSCQIMQYIEFNAKDTIIDVGTGAGFPGLPLAMIGDSQFSLMDSLAKRIRFLDHVIDATKLNRVKTFHSRAEDLAHNQSHRGHYDYVVSRAVTQLPILLEYTVPFLKVGGRLIAYKAADIKDELESANLAIKILNCELNNIIEYSDKNNTTRHFIIIKKVAETAKKYPRKAGTPQKRPL